MEKFWNLTPTTDLTPEQSAAVGMVAVRLLGKLIIVGHDRRPV